MTDDNLAQYSFVPWFQRGAAADIVATDDLTATATGRAQLAVQLSLSYQPLGGGAAASNPTINRTVELIGPGDVTGLRPEAVLRTYPPAGSRDASPGELAYLEFYDEDLPWRYTPARAATVSAGGASYPRLRPWLALLVLREGEYSVAPRAGGIQVLTVAPATELPPVLESWAWAHAQLAGGAADPAAAGSQAQDDPDTALSRLLSPRRLEPLVPYTAFVVPAFETGRLAGLGLDTTQVPTQQASWRDGQTDRRFPVYYSWQFATGVDGTFESYVRRLTAQPVGPDFGKRAMDVTAPGYGLEPVAGVPTLPLEGALRPPDFTRDPYPQVPGANLVDQLESLVDLGSDLLDPDTGVPDDPIVAPPAYGRLPAGVWRLSDVADTDQAGWVRELNLDPRNRAVAGLGAQVVRDRQEEFVARAWDQVGLLRDANQRLREAELAMTAAQAVYGKHMDGLPDDRLLLLTAAAHRGLPANPAAASQARAAAGMPGRLAGTATEPLGSVYALVAGSRVPTCIEDAAFKRVTRPARAFVRVATGSTDVLAFQSGLVTGMDAAPGQAISAARPLAPPEAAVTLTTVSNAVTAAVRGMGSHANEPKRVFLKLAADDLAARMRPDGTLATPDKGQLINALKARLNTWKQANPQATDAASRVLTLINAISAVRADGPAAVVDIGAAAFTAEFGKQLASKGYCGVTAASASPPLNGKMARMTDTDAAVGYQRDMASLGGDLAARQRQVPPAPPALGGVPGIAAGLASGLDPRQTVHARVLAALPGLAGHLAEQAATQARRLRPVLRYPAFPDPMVDALQALAREYVVPNLADLPMESLTLMEPNGRFIESYLAGLNTELARELLWREYPTDQRGSYFRVFWDKRDAGPGAIAAEDILELNNWTQALGSNGLSAATPLVLVIRSELLRKFPNTLVYAQQATWAGAPSTGRRTLDLSAPVKLPIFSANLDPDVLLYGFDLREQQARGHVPAGPDDPEDDPEPADPGWFFVLKERPGQLRFGLDSSAPAGGFTSWDDLWWGQVPGSETYLRLGNTGSLAPAGDEVGTWAATSADMAAILFRSPVMYARHADDLLPAEA